MFSWTENNGHFLLMRFYNFIYFNYIMDYNPNIRIHVVAIGLYTSLWIIIKQITSHRASTIEDNMFTDRPLVYDKMSIRLNTKNLTIQRCMRTNTLFIFIFNNVITILLTQSQNSVIGWSKRIKFKKINLLHFIF